MKRALVALGLLGALAIVGTGTAAAQPSSGDVDTASTSVTGHHTVSPNVVTCEVEYNNTPYYDGPGYEHKKLGTVNAGQFFDVYANQGTWYEGDLWGGQGGVWIQGDSLTGCDLP